MKEQETINALADNMERAKAEKKTEYTYYYAAFLKTSNIQIKKHGRC
jgi:hypothetical protein